MRFPLGFVLALAAASALSASSTQRSSPTAPRTATYIIRQEEQQDFLLLDLVWSRRRLLSAVIAYKDRRGQILVPFQQCALAMGFRLEVDPAKMTAKGFLFAPSDRIVVDFLKGEAHSKVRLTHFTTANWCMRDGEIYVDSQLFSTLTGSSLEWHPDLLELWVVARLPLPIEVQQQLQRRSSALDEVAHKGPEPTRVLAPYKWWSLPTLDVDLNSQVGGGSGQPAADWLQVRGAGDLLKMGGRYTLISDNSGKPASFLMSLGQSDDTSRLLGPLRATQFEIGDLSIDPIPLLARGHAGLGATVSNCPVTDQIGASKLEGHAPAGFTIELYRSERLVDQAVASQSGAYEFKGLLLGPGPNRFHIVEISPRGAIRESDATLFGDLTAPEKGLTRYRLTAVQGGASLVPGGALYNPKNLGGPQFIAQADRSLAPGTWMSGTAATLVRQRASYLGVGLNTWRGGSQWGLNAMTSDSGGLGMSLSMTRQLPSGALTFEHTLFAGPFRSGLAPESGTGASSVTTLQIDGWSRLFGRQISYGLAADRIAGDATRTLVRLHVAGGSPKLFVFNTLQTGVGGQPLATTGLLNMEKHVGRVSANLDVAYGFGQGPFLTGAALSLGKNVARDYRVALRGDYQSALKAPFELTGTFYRLLGPLAFGLNLGIGQGTRPVIGLQLSTSLAGSNRLGYPSFASPGSSDLARITARVFLDKNVSGVYDKGDVLLQDVGITVNRRLAGRTASNGACVLKDLGTRQDLTVAVDEGSLEDPYWMPASAGVVVHLRSGCSASYDFAVVVGSEVDGTVSLPPSDEDLIAQLVDASGGIVATSTVDDGGQYVFSRVRQGHYTLRVLDPSGSTLSDKSLNVP
jgi:hypothetical protein